MLLVVEAPEHVRSIVIKSIQSDFRSALRKAGISYDSSVKRKEVIPVNDDLYIQARKTIDDGMVNIYSFRVTCAVGKDSVRFEGIVLHDDDLYVTKITRVIKVS
jgi:hypothetical protein